MPEQDEFIERRIVTGLIVSTDYIREVSRMWSPHLLSSSTARILAGWCLDYFEKYKKAPGKDIEGIFVSHLKDGSMPDNRAEDIQEILSNLSEDHERGQFNTPYLLDQTKAHFNGQNLRHFTSEVLAELETGSPDEATRLAASFAPVAGETHKAIDPFSSASRIRAAFAEKAKPLVAFPKELGKFWNEQLVRDSLVAFMGPEKRGKTFMLMEMAMKGLASGCNVVFFQAGDMSENQQIRRLCIYLTRRSDQERYCGGLYVPVVDCLYNQLNTCTRKERECDFGSFEELEEDAILNITHEDLAKAFKALPDYKACRNCTKLKGVPWYKWRAPVQPLEWREAWRESKQFQNKLKKRLRLCTYANGTLSVSEMTSLLDTWERLDNFVPDVIVVDYADLLIPDSDFGSMDYRHRTNAIWERLRGLSQVKHCLVVTATQAAATSYGKELIGLTDFAEDKRKYAHATAMYGLNQTDREKKIGVMRINEVVLREGAFDIKSVVHVLQRLEMGRPFLGSYR